MDQELADFLDAKGVSPAPGKPLIIAPAPKTTPDVRPKLDFTILKEFLEKIGTKLPAQPKGPIKIVVIGGIVNVFHLKSRKITHDINFFLAKPMSIDNAKVYRAADLSGKEIERTSRRANRSLTLGEGWFNNLPQTFMDAEMQQSLALEAFTQNVILQQTNTIVVYAASWKYAFCSKLDRYCEKKYTKGKNTTAKDTPSKDSKGKDRKGKHSAGNSNKNKDSKGNSSAGDATSAAEPQSNGSNDIADATAYLEQLIQCSDAETVSIKELLQWMNRYKFCTTDLLCALRKINDAYYTKFRKNPFSGNKDRAYEF